MARMIYPSPQQPPLTQLYLVDRAVGRNCPNHRHDVLLVQFFLRALTGASTQVPLDGACGRQTLNYIRYFQTVGTRGGGGGTSRRPNIQDIQDGTSNTVVLGESNSRNAGHPGHIHSAHHGSHGHSAGTRGQNNLKQIGLAGQNSPGSVQFSDGSVRTVGGVSPSHIQDGTSNTIIIGEQPPADADQHVRQHYGIVRAPRYGEPLDCSSTIVQLNLAYCRAYGGDRFRHIDMDPYFPRELFPAFFGFVCGELDIRPVREAHARTNRTGGGVLNSDI